VLEVNKDLQVLTEEPKDHKVVVQLSRDQKDQEVHKVYKVVVGREDHKVQVPLHQDR
jgi:hypothetical protein